MTLSDPIADLLTRIRNALMAKQRYIDVPLSREKKDIVQILKKKGFVYDFFVDDSTKKGKLRILLKYTKTREPIIAGLKRMSKPSLRHYVKSSEIPRVLGGIGISIISTSQGIIDGEEARTKNIGGELLCLIW